MSSTSSQLYFPLEHIAWAADARLLSANSAGIWTAAIVLWGVSLVASCVKSCFECLRLSKQLSALGPTVVLHSGPAVAAAGEEGRHREAAERTGKRVTFEDFKSGARARIRAAQRQRRLAALTVVQCLCDLLNAVHWMPRGFLWAGKSPRFLVGLLGTISSLISLYMKIM